VRLALVTEQIAVEGYSALIIYTLAVIGLVAAMLILSSVLGQLRHTKATLEPYESGIVPVGSARLRLSVDYYLVAILFVIFDLEAVFLFAWAVAFKESGWAGFIEASVFITVLVAALFYLWKMGALRWGPKQQTRPPRKLATEELLKEQGLKEKNLSQ
jgi:NADH-quinone oxidoreductase subunit A